ncbi:MAG: fructosamine kinase [Betaproteobacteria bacterium]|nr:fructosamine kinase [Betaproteobacteria bacterium]
MRSPAWPAISSAGIPFSIEARTAIGGGCINRCYRINLYNLYHVLNHFNLFGGGYAVQAETPIGRLLAEI